MSLSSAPWYEIATGVIAIPAALLGLLYTFRLSQKTRFEGEKLRRELEKDTVLSEELFRKPSAFPQFARSPVVEGYIIRFILLEMGLHGWSFLVGIASPFLSLLQYYLDDALIFHGNQGLESFTEAALFTYLTSLGRWLLFLAIGVPLFLDITRDLGLSPLRVLTERIQTPSVRSAATVLGVVVLSVLASILALHTATAPSTRGETTLLSRQKYDNYTKATYNFRVATRDDVARTRNRWDIIFGSGDKGNSFEAMNEPSEIFDLGEISLYDAKEAARALATRRQDDTLETEVSVHKDHSYLFSAYDDRWHALIAIHVIDNVPGDSVSFSWEIIGE